MNRFQLILITFLFIVPCTTSAYDFGCQDVWEGPSADNDPVECIIGLKDRDFGMLVPPLVGAIITGCMLIFFPATFLCRIFGACGSNEPRPGSECCCDGEEWDYVEEEVKLSMYPKSYVSKVKGTGFLVFVSSAFCIVGIVYGTYLSFEAIDVVLVAVKTEVLDWVGDTLAAIQRTVKTSDGSYIQPVTNDTFSSATDLYDWAKEQYETFDRIFHQESATVTYVLYSISCVPTVGLLFILIMAFFNVRRVMPKLFQCFYFFFGLLFGAVGTAILVVGVGGLMICGEATLQQWKSPGIFQWYIIPQCEAQTVLANVTNQIRSMEVENSISACRETLAVCDEGSVYDISEHEKIFSCNLTESNIALVCGSFEEMNHTILSLPFKSGTAALCPSCSSYSDCPTKCTDEGLRNKTRQSIEIIKVALNASTTISKFLPELDCDSLTTRLLSPLFKGGQCERLSLGLLLIGGGASFACLVYLWGIIVLCKGQKLFFDRRALFGDEVIEIEVKSAKWQKERI